MPSIREIATRWIISGLAFGFFVPRIDNWAHLGGLAGGYLASFWLDPFQPERGVHSIMAARVPRGERCSPFVVSVVTGLPIANQG